MPQQSLYPIRQGLNVPRGENLQSTEILCEGGLDLTQSIFETRPGFASRMVNFEPSLTGGYRRINGYTKFGDPFSPVPGTGRIRGVFISPAGNIFAARTDATWALSSVYNLFKYNKFTGAWDQVSPLSQTLTGTLHTNTLIDGIASTTGLVPGMKVTGANIPLNTVIVTVAANSVTLNQATTFSVTESVNFHSFLSYTAGGVLDYITSLQFIYLNWTGTNKILFSNSFTEIVSIEDENSLTLYNSCTCINTVGNPFGSNYIIEFANYLFAAVGHSVKISAPLDYTDWQPVDGAAEIVIGNTITGMGVWRDELYIFGVNEIHRIIGNSTDPFSSTPFTLEKVSSFIGCNHGRTIQEINGDLLFLAGDGIRTISGTMRIGDTDIGCISKPIQSIANSINQFPPGDVILVPAIDSPNLNAVVVRKKTQYRLFRSAETQSRLASKGILTTLRRFRDGHEDWEFGELIGIKATCCSSTITSELVEGVCFPGEEIVLHGSSDGFVYKQEDGFTFDGEAINEIYLTVPMELGDRTIRKSMHRITLNIDTDSGSIQLFLSTIYDLNNPNIIQPARLSITDIGASFVYYDTDVTYDTGATYDTVGKPTVRQNIQGSGFVVQFMFTSMNTETSYTIQGFDLEYYPAGRR